MRSDELEGAKSPRSVVALRTFEGDRELDGTVGVHLEVMGIGPKARAHDLDPVTPFGKP
jgi:hypothetical protein